MQIIHLKELIIKSILETHILKAYVTNKTELHIYANKIEKLDKYIDKKLEYNLVIYMMHCLSKQQLFLEKIEYCFYTFRLKDIVVIDDKYFFCINPELVIPIKNKNILTFFKLPKRENDFSSPELLAINSIPFKISYKTIYYSFGALAKYYLSNLYYEHTKLDWFIRRCMNINIEQRQILFI